MRTSPFHLTAVICFAASASTALAAQPGLSPEDVASQNADARQPISLLAPAPEGATPETGVGIARSRAASLEVQRLDAITPGSDRSLELQLFDDVSYEIVPDRIIDNGPGAYVWRGRLQQDPNSRVTIAVRDGDAFGEVRDMQSGRVFEIRHNHPDFYSVIELDSFALPTCGILAEHAITVAEDAGAPGDVAFARGQQEEPVDILVVYTQAAQDIGSMGPLIDAAVDVTNQSYEDSQMQLRIRLVETALVDYNETGVFSIDLDRLRGTGDIYMPEVHTLRNDNGADMVALLVSGGDACGIAYKMNTPSVFFDDNAFSVTARSCAVGNRTFAHELGHNFGCNHDRDNSGGGGSYPYSYGHRTTNNFRTIMAYAPGTRVSFFSNPNIGAPPLGVPVGQPGEAYNALGIDNVRDIATQWRESTQSIPCPADLNGDGSVGSSDLGILLGSWGTTGSSDIDGGGVGSSDLAAMLGAWGPCPS